MFHTEIRVNHVEDFAENYSYIQDISMLHICQNNAELHTILVVLYSQSHILISTKVLGVLKHTGDGSFGPHVPY